MNNNDKQKSSMIGILIIAIWGCILIGMMLKEINEFTNQTTYNIEYK